MSPVKQQIPLRIGLEDEAQFDNFYSGEGDNLKLLHYLQEANPDLLYLFGKPASGVSHLLIALTKRAEALGDKVQYVPLKDLAGAPAEMLQQLEHLDLLCIDDIELVIGDVSWQQEVFHLFNRARQEGTRIVFGGHSTPTDLKIDLADLKSRVLAGQTWAVQELSDEEKLSALKSRAALRGFNLSDRVANYLLGHRQRDMSTLMGYLNKLERLSLEEKKLVSWPLVKRLIENQ